MGLPKLFFDNRLADATPVASSTATGNFAAANLADFRPYTWWKPTTMPATVTVDCGRARPADYLALYNHASNGATYEVHGSTDNFAASDVTVGLYWANSDDPALLLFNSASYQYWRLVVLGCENLFIYSEQLGNAAWTKSGVSVSENAAVAPDGTSTADLVIEDSGASRHTIYQSPSGEDAQAEAVTLSAYAQQGVGSRYLVLYCATGGFQGADRFGKCFDITNGVAAAGGVTSAGFGVLANYGIEDVGDGWYRCWVSGTAAGTASTELVGCCALNDTFTGLSIGNSRTGDGSSAIYLWGVQYEESPYPSDYIKTTAAAAVNPPVLSIAAIGAAFEMPRRLPMGFDARGRDVVGISNVNDNGHPLGDIIQYGKWKQKTLSFLVDESFVRNTFEPVWDSHLRGAPFIFAWDVENYPTDIKLLKCGKGFAAPRKAGVLCDLSFDVSGVVA